MTSRSFLLTIFLVVQNHTLFARELNQYIGAVNPQIPADCRDLGGGIVISRENADIAFKQIYCKNYSLFLLQEQIDKWPSLKWRVLDVLTFPHPRDGLSILTPEYGCSYKGDAAWIIAIGRWVEKDVGGFATNIEKAWIISNNPKESRFKQVAASKVTCAYSEDRD